MFLIYNAKSKQVLSVPSLQKSQKIFFKKFDIWSGLMNLFQK